MFWNKRTEAKQIEVIRKKWNDYRIPPEDRKKSLVIINPFTEACLTLINFIGITNPSKAAKYEEEFTRTAGLFSRDCFLLGMEYGSSNISDEAHGILLFICEPLSKLMTHIITESIELGAAPRRDKDRIIRITIDRIDNISRQSYEIGVSHNPRYVESSQKVVNTATTLSINEKQDKIRYFFAHVYLPESLFELPQMVYENLASGNGNDFLLF